MKTEDSNLCIGLIGAGRIGKLHAENLKHRIKGCELVAVSDVMESVAQDLAKSLDIPRIYSDHRRILESADVDAVVICASTDGHAQIISDAASAGKHIFCEKPIALDLGVIDRVLDEVDRAGVLLQIGFNRRFDNNFKRMHELLQTGEIGTPHLLRITSRDPSPPPIEYIKKSGGIFLDMTIHDFDMARFLIQSEVDQVYAAGEVNGDKTIAEAGDLDTVMVTLTYKNGVLATIDNSRMAVYGYDQRVEVFGSGGMISAQNELINGVTISNGAAIHGALPKVFFLDRYRESYIAELKAFIESIVNDRVPAVTGADGRAPVVLGYAAAKSVQENRPVKISEIS